MAKSSGSFKPTHGMSKTRLYREWAGIIYRCTNPKCSSYNRYGAKGVTFCKEWRKFEPFAEWALSHGYTDDLTIDRINTSKGYEPNNCRWVTVREQNNNTSKTVWLTHNDETLPISYWADKTGIKKHTLYDRIFRYGWSIEKALTTPVRRNV